jgi:hypothetical protein
MNICHFYRHWNNFININAVVDAEHGLVWIQVLQPINGDEPRQTSLRCIFFKLPVDTI